MCIAPFIYSTVTIFANLTIIYVFEKQSGLSGKGTEVSIPAGIHMVSEGASGQNFSCVLAKSHLKCGHVQTLHNRECRC